MFPHEGRKSLIHLTARDQPLKDATEFFHRKESTSGRQPGLTQTFCVIFARSHPPSVSQIFISKISLEIHWLDCTGGVIWFHFSFQKYQVSVKLKYLSGARGEQQTLQEGSPFTLPSEQDAQGFDFGFFYLVFTERLLATRIGRAAILGMSGG